MAGTASKSSLHFQSILHASKSLCEPKLNYAFFYFTNAHIIASLHLCRQMDFLALICGFGIQILRVSCLNRLLKSLSTCEIGALKQNMKRLGHQHKTRLQRERQSKELHVVHPSGYNFVCGGGVKTGSRFSLVAHFNIIMSISKK